METLLLEKNRITDEKKAHEFALEGIVKEHEIKIQVRGFKQRLELAKELKARGQVRLFERAIGKIERAYRIAHKNPYPECTKQEAMDAMCEPIKPPEPSPVEKVKGSLNENMRKALTSAMQDAERLMEREKDRTLRQSINQIGTYERMMNMQQERWGLGLGGFSGLSAQMGSTWARQSMGFSNQTHKYDLACATLNMADLSVEGSLDTEVMLPMAALCRLKEAKEKKMFDSFQVWRPAEWKAPDPWLVGVWNEEDGKTHYFKVCDWR